MTGSASEGDGSLPPIQIRPEVTVLSVLRHLNYKAWFALAEFIDNSLQSAIANHEALSVLHEGKYQLSVDIMLDSGQPGQITIRDNAAGIAIADYPRAFRPAQVPTDRTGLSEFGMGMKSAACWFAENWTVRTKAIGEDVERTISFDVKHIVENRIESLGTTVRTVDPKAHYTVVSLRNLHHLPQGRTIGKIKDHLASIYRVFIRDGRLQLTFNGEPLQYESPKTLTADRYSSPGYVAPDDSGKPVEWRKDIDLDFGEGQRVKGFAMIREVGSTPLAGFSLFRRDRLIVGSHDETYRPSQIFKQTNSYAYQRIAGELHVEGFEVSHTKDGFRWEEFEDEFLDCLKDELTKAPLNLISQAENYRALLQRKTIEKAASAASQAVAEHVEKNVRPLLVESRQNPSEPAPVPAEVLLSSPPASERDIRVDDGQYVWLIKLRTTIDPSIENWISLGLVDQKNGDTGYIRRLGIDIALAHPFSSEFIGADFSNVELFLRFAVAVSISLMLTEDLTGQSPDTALSNLNHLMRTSMAQAQL
ncbi:MAG: hypothetical protein ABS98_03320 [Lysobacteraceae bacterium SCN 69-48]|nr:MAG: hypothetical protein ABS98_03320 [Xanthomonadaceae bacterium SCN 69-48]